MFFITFFTGAIKCISAAFLSLIFCVNMFFFTNDALMKVATSAPTKKEVYIAQRDLFLDIYTPSDKNPRSKLLIIHGATEFGKNDTRLIKICDLLARSGFQLYVPDVKELMQWDIGSTGVSDIIYVYKKYLLNENKISKGMLSYSVGCAPLFIAAADKQINADINHLISFGGYYDTKNVLLFLTTGFYNENGVWKKYPREKNISRVFLERNISLVKEEERNVVRKIIEEGPKENLLNALSVESQNLIMLIYNNDRKDFFKFYKGISPKVKEAFENISPKKYLKDIKADCYIAHSVPDFVIPHTESDLLLKALKNKVKGNYRFRFFSHVEKKFQSITFKKIFSEYLPDTLKFYIFIYRIFML